uniref:Heat shock factor-binding protein 1 n=3 Tax=Cyprinus carpio TaxID=7962 RepID=A0A8C1G9J8_CYPCA
SVYYLKWLFLYFLLIKYTEYSCKCQLDVGLAFLSHRAPPLGHKNYPLHKSKSRSADLSSLTKPLNNEISDCFGGSFHLEYITQYCTASTGLLITRRHVGGFEENMSEKDPKTSQDLTVVVQTLLQQMQDKFQTMSDQIIGRIDEMSTRIDDLEKNISDLMTQAGVEELEEETKVTETSGTA